MRVLIDATTVTGGGGLTVLREMLRAWPDSGDQLLLVGGPDDPGLGTVPTLAVQETGGFAERFVRQQVWLPKVARKVRPDVILSMAPSAPYLRHVPSVLVLHDVRDRVLPHEFSRGQRTYRRLHYPASMRRADAIVSVSQRSADDLARFVPSVTSKVVVVRLGSEHVDRWADGPSDIVGPYALLVGGRVNKGADLAKDAWATWDLPLPLVVVDSTVSQRTVSPGRTCDVIVVPPGDDVAFERRFRRASVVLMPSTFEGFGLPAVEAQALGIPVVVSPDPALVEVTSGAVILDSLTADALGAAVNKAVALGADDLAASQAEVRQRTWRDFAGGVRESLLFAVGGRG
jgi:glycosyltransferase involved in cell wall biosynthesis